MHRFGATSSNAVLLHMDVEYLFTFKLIKSFTVIVVPAKVLSVDKQIVILVQLPKLAIDDVEVLVGEEVRYLVDVLLLVEGRQYREEVRLAQLGNRNAARPGAVHAIKYAGYHLKN